MPKDGDPLSAEEVAAVRQWIAAGAAWPADLRLQEQRVSDTNWWSLQPLVRPAIPDIAGDDASWVRNPIDAYILAQLRQAGLRPAPEADRRTLIRRLYFDLLGLPPPPGEIESFLFDTDPLAYEHLVDRLLESPHYGERWARHWLDVVHYGDTHGYDKDKPRPNAWPYRDYVIRALNTDKPYAQFLREQIAGDVLDPDSAEAVVATGFIAAGPWDFISHVEVPESKIDGQVARSLDRDDMVRTVMETVISTTIGCARCHNHKFDPITQEDYYRLQAVFAAVDRADRAVDTDPAIGRRRRELVQSQQQLQQRRDALESRMRELAGAPLGEIDQQIATLAADSGQKPRPEFGYHSNIEAHPDMAKWVQIDLGRPTMIEKIVYVGCHDDFNGIGAGFGFPARYRIDISDDPEFATDVVAVADLTGADVVNPGVEPQVVQVQGRAARYVRVTATRLAPRQNDYIFALAELQVYSPAGENVASRATVTALDSIEAPVRWQKSNLVDGYYYGAQLEAAQQQLLQQLHQQRRELLERAVPATVRDELKQVDEALTLAGQALAELPAPQMVYAAATDFAPQGNFQPTKGQPREIRLLRRGDVTQPGPVTPPGALQAIPGMAADFALSSDDSEGARRAALAQWLTHHDHPLTWRSIANRVWLYHFGRGLVDTPNDFGRMGETPTHPQLLDWLAVEFRDGGQSLKSLHRLICNSATYRQSSSHDPAAAEIDATNRYYWRMNRRRLEAESLRDAVLAVSGKLDRSLYGPGFQDFVIEKPEHSPHYQYHLHDPDDPRSLRRSVYRFLVRSQQQPFMRTMDCADPSMQVDKRNETVTALQALALLNNRFMIAMSRHLAQRVTAPDGDLRQSVQQAFQLALGRAPDGDELDQLVQYTEQHGLANTCRLIFNLNEFVFVD
jgi:hypothetical protein